MNRIITTLTTLAAAALFACGGDVTLNSGVDGNKKLSEIDMNDVTKLCDAAEKAADQFATDTQPGACKFSGALAAAFAPDAAQREAICETAVMACEQEPLMTTTGMCTLDDQPDCEATIGEVETCFNDSLAEANRIFGEFASRSCAELLDPTATQDIANVMNPASCAALSAKCPNLDVGFGSTMTSSSS